MELGDGKDFLRDILEIYLTDTPLQLSALRDCLASGDQAGFARAAHTIKGSSANVGTMRVQALAEQIEKRSRQESIQGLSDEVEKLVALFNQAKCELELLV